MAETNLIVGRIRIAGGVRADADAPAELSVAAGDVIQVKLPFRFDEVSVAREDYEIRLATTIDGADNKDARVVGKDHPALSDDKRGFLMTEHVITNAGQHVLDFKATCQLEVSEWVQGETSVQEAAFEGQVIVTVR